MSTEVLDTTPTRRDGRIHCLIARGADIDRAIAVRRRVYIEEFGFDVGTEGDELDRRAYHLLALSPAREPIASLRCVDAPARPFEIESFVNLSGVIDPRRHPAEITRFCVLPAFRRVSTEMIVHVSMLRALLRLARTLGATDLVGSARPELIGLYRYILYDVYPEMTYVHPKIGNVPHVFIRLDLMTLRQRYRRERPQLYRLLRAALTP